ncbi:hypothetical protein LRS13_07935 [Svornostia abyssi]|uniref:Uncharacterized protein n=1 Tax=Svornostia abyssi TaxID=2898438 RepID=A0ABY5PL85_9ACTN|nr:hypothetical protein LRS13_07935 [Parviterribacteraceae bacterium J379]
MRVRTCPVPLVVAGMLAAFGAPEAHAASADPSPRFIAPSSGQLVTGPQVAVTVRAPRAVTRVTATLDGAPVTARFRKGADGAWHATLRRRALRPGANRITVTTRTAGGRTGRRVARFSYGTRARPFTQVRVSPAIRGSAAVSLTTSADPRLRLRATLNGRAVTGVFLPRSSARRTARLGADDGLRHGRNVLRVSAVRPDGTYAIVRRAFTVSASRPLVGAGAHRRTTPRETVRLTGRYVPPPGTSASDVRYRWQVIRAPRGAKARPKTARDRVARFTPDKVGTYRLRLTARATTGARAAQAPVVADEVTVSSVADIPPIGTPVTTLTPDASILIGGSTYAYDPTQDAVQVVAIDRGTQEVLYENAFEGSASDVNTLLNQLAQYDTPLVFLADLDYDNESIVDASWNKVVQAIGGTPIPAITTGSSGGWSVVGVPGTPAGSAFQNNGTARNSSNPTQGAMQGYLQLDANDAFAFVPAERLQLDLAAPGAPAGQNQMVVGSSTFASGPLADGGTACSGGIQIVTLSAENLIPAANRTFATNGCGASADAANLQAATSYVQSLGAGSTSGTLLALVQTIGVPRDPATDPSLWSSFANAVGGLGGTITAVGDGSGSYSLVAGLGISGFPLVEGSSAFTGQPARITGVLQRARNGNFTPLVSSQTGSFQYGLATLAYQAPQPANPTAGQQAALAYIAETVLDLNAPAQGESCYVPATPDVRSEYCNSKYYNSWGGFASQLRGLAYPSGQSFSATDWTTVINQLAPKEGYGEFNAVGSLWSTISTAQGTNTQDSVQAVALAQQEAATIVGKLTGASSTVGSWLTFLGDLSDAADRLAEVVSEDLGGPLGFIAAGLLVSGDTANLPNGAPNLGAFNVQAADFAADLAESYGQATSELTHLGDLIVSDPGKLEDFDQGSQYALNDTPALNTGLTLAAAQFGWKSLFPAAFQIIQLPQGTGVNTGVTDARNYQCSVMYGSQVGSYYPFPNAQPSAQLLNPTLWVVVRKGAGIPNGSNGDSPATPPASLTDPLFQPYASGGNGITQYGLVKDWFYREAFNLGTAPVVNC